MSQESKKQTTVEWLVEKLENEATLDYSHSQAHKIITLDVHTFNSLLEQAKEMDKEQKEFCWDIAYLSGGFVGQGLPPHEFPTFEQYYTGVYGKQQNG